MAWELVTRAGTAVGTAPDGSAVAFAAGAFAAGAFAAGAAGAFAAGAFAVSVSDEPHATAITNKSAITIDSIVLTLSNLYLDM